jgi:preprotein translocase subunit SecY
MAYDLQPFLKQALEKGETHESITHALKKAGWPDEEIAPALRGFVIVDGFTLPVPRREPYVSAREAFLYLVLFLTLYITAVSLGTLLFSFIERAVPDILQTSRYTSMATLSTIRTSTASLIITFPIFTVLNRVLEKGLERDPQKRGSKVRKWLTYLTLFVAAVTIIIDLITLVGSLLSGELTTRFLLKVAVVLLIAGTAFSYYLWDLRRDETLTQA